MVSFISTYPNKIDLKKNRLFELVSTTGCHETRYANYAGSNLIDRSRGRSEGSILFRDSVFRFSTLTLAQNP